MKKVCFAKRFAICIFISTLIFSNVTGCGKKKDSGKDPVKDAKEVAKDYIFKDEEIEGIIGAQSYVSYLEYSDGKLRCAYRAEDENYTFVTLNEDLSVEQTTEIPIAEKNVWADFATDNEGNIYVKYEIYKESEENTTFEGGEKSGDDAGAAEAATDAATVDESAEAATDATTDEAEKADEASSDDSVEASKEAGGESTYESVYYGDILGSYLVKYDNTGKEIYKVDLLKEFPADKEKEARNIVWVKDHGLLLSTTKDIEVYDEEKGFTVLIDNESLKQFDEWGAAVVKGSNGQLFVYGYSQDGEQLMKIDLDSKQLGEPSKIFDEVDYCSFFGGEGYDLYAQDDSSIYGYDAKTDKLVKLIDIADSELGIGYGIDNCVAVSDTLMYATIPDAESNYYLAKLTKVKPEDVKDKTIITLGGIYNSYDLVKQIYKFNKKNDEYKIKYVDYSEAYASEDMSYDDLVKQFNMDVLSGKAPDIIAFNGYLNVNNYVNKGILVDLTPQFEKGGAFENIEILPNIYEMMQIKGKVYTVFPTFSLTTIVMRDKFAEGKTSLTFEDCDELIKGVGTDYKLAFGYCSNSRFLSMGIEFGGKKYIDWENKKCDFNNPDFIELLEFANRLPNEADYDYDNYDNYYKNFIEDKSIFMEEYLSGFEGYGNASQGVFKGDVALLGFPNSAGENESGINPGMELGVYSKSEHTDVAIEFIKDIFNSDDPEMYYYSFPTDKAAFEAATKSVTEPRYRMVNGKKEADDIYYWDGEKQIKGRPLTQEEAQKIHDYVLSAKTLIKSDMKLDEIIEEESSAFFSGQKSAEEVAGIIQGRVTTYINENS